MANPDGTGYRSGTDEKLGKGVKKAEKKMPESVFRHRIVSNCTTSGQHRGGYRLQMVTRRTTPL
jgi:hypothetical protein